MVCRLMVLCLLMSLPVVESTAAASNDVWVSADGTTVTISLSTAGCGLAYDISSAATRDVTFTRDPSLTFDTFVIPPNPGTFDRIVALVDVGFRFGNGCEVVVVENYLIFQKAARRIIPPKQQFPPQRIVPHPHSACMCVRG